MIKTIIRNLLFFSTTLLLCAAQDPIGITPDGYNCEPLTDDFHVRWRILDDMLDVELLGRVDRGTYMGFGISGLPQTQTLMTGADAVVADMTDSGPRVQDIYMDTRASCNALAEGVCPDTAANFTNDVINISGEESSGLTLIRYSRPLVPTDTGTLTSLGEAVDMTIPAQPGVDTFVVWALGPMSDDGLPLFHNLGFPQSDVSLDFGRGPVIDNCPLLVDVETCGELFESCITDEDCCDGGICVTRLLGPPILRVCSSQLVRLRAKQTVGGAGRGGAAGRAKAGGTVP